MLYRPAFLFLLLVADLAEGFSSVGGPTGSPKSSDEPEVVTRNFVEITNLNDIGRKESLPASFIERWPNWFLESDGRLVRIPDQETGSASGFVTPTSIDQIYQPVDLKRPEIKLAVGVHIRSGTIRHVLPALDVSYGKGLHRNRGLCSVPLAYNWVDFGFLNSMGDYNRYQLRLMNSSDQGWNELFSLPGSVIRKAIERAIVCLAESDSDDLGNGSHIIHVALDDAKVFEMPKPKTSLRVAMVETADEGEEDVEVGTLEVAILSTMSGSESEYLPEAYKPLFSDESLRNPLYAKFKKQKAERAEEEEKARNEAKQEL
mmetsp:Transcript_12267/g.35032  ORF Transcript_12267/g.35032 Transcript_12267/m.35032 type:complete len:317 (+) Transcript_12267:87-1037(+)